MEAAQLVNWTSVPSLAISPDGRIVAANSACEALTGHAPQALLGRHCSDVVRATDIHGEPVCRAEGCPTLASLAEGHATCLAWSAWLRDGGGAIPLRATTIAVPPGERSDQAAAVLVLHLEEPARLADVPSEVRVHLLGRMECFRDGEPQVIRRRRVFELLALLALAGDAGVARDHLVTTLWPDAPRGNGRQHLRVLLHALRAALGPDIVETVAVPCATEAALRLDPAAWVDVRAFLAGVERARDDRDPSRGDPEVRLQDLGRLVSLYRGDLDEAGEFGEWVTPVREQLREQFLALLAEAIPLAAQAGLVEQAVEYCRRAIAADPLDEGFQAALLAAYGRLGRRGAALAQYRDYERTLAEELGIEPPPAVQRAFREAVGPLEVFT